VKIFVSYSRGDAGDFAEQIHKDLENEHDIFTDVNSIKKGFTWSTIIEDNIPNCDLFVILITNAALKSHEIEKEVLIAQNRGKMIIPCTTDM
jgi:TIR domain